uniref:Uncharacterized protein n=1 Tax=Candidatus Kentrum sp. FW TaxID=2126338 RepID=A0A450SKL7_9GAMM|nr:MAG: hypothetical protein BECKFW1821B_GA0114236_10176 [Candidatus Kentron sp. FW]
MQLFSQVLDTMLIIGGCVGWLILFWVSDFGKFHKLSLILLALFGNFITVLACLLLITWGWAFYMFDFEHPYWKIIAIVFIVFNGYGLIKRANADQFIGGQEKMESACAEFWFRNINFGLVLGVLSWILILPLIFMDNTH